MSGQPQYDWPATDALVALVQKHGQAGAASLLGVPQTTFVSHLRREGVPPEERRQAKKTLNLDALKEVADLVK
jgi:hypothetical protein